MEIREKTGVDDGDVDAVARHIVNRTAEEMQLRTVIGQIVICHGGRMMGHQRKTIQSKLVDGPLGIKLQKFDGSSSWETWWAHFKNCASYNRWTEREKIAFMKGALTGNAAQVLWDTDRSAIVSLQKLVDMLKSRYSGERQAEKYRAELHIRRRRHNESLSDLHQDVRRLMALAYPKLMAEAREEIACDHFANALNDADFALKIKERTPTSSDEALRIALRLEAWEKSARMSKYDEDRMDHARQKVRAVGKQQVPKNSELSEDDSRIKKMEADMNKISANVKKVDAVTNINVKKLNSLKQCLTATRPT